MAKVESETLEKCLVQVRRIAESREKGAERKILKLYKELIKDLYGFLGEEYINYSDEDGKLTRAQLMLKGEYARFLEEVNNRVNTIPAKVRDEVSELINETYEQCWQGMIDGVNKSKNVQELHDEFSAIRAIRPEVVKAAVENPIPKLRLTPTMERNRKNVIYEINREIFVGLANGDGIKTMGKRLYNRVNVSYGRSILIARTEAHRVRETGLNDASQKVDEILKEHGSEFRKVKIWNTSGDSSVRDTHAKMHGVAVLVDEEFELPSGAKARCPGTSGVASEDCNCRCFLTYDIVTDSEFYQLTGRHFPKSELTNGKKSDTIISGAVSGALNPYSEQAKNHAEQYYESVRHMTTDCKNIAQNTEFTEEEIRTVKSYIFTEKHDLGRGKDEYFDPSYEMAQSWQRLIDGKNIQPHDLTMINHELMERDLIKRGMTQDEAHKVTSKKYNYSKESWEYYDKLETDKKNK